jgi:hypothetical protein
MWYEIVVSSSYETQSRSLRQRFKKTAINLTAETPAASSRVIPGSNFIARDIGDEHRPHN